MTSNYAGIAGTNVIQVTSRSTNVGTAATATNFPFARGLVYVVIRDSGVANQGSGTMSFFMKGGITNVPGDLRNRYFINEFIRTNFDTTLGASNLGPDTMVVTNASTGAEYTLILNSLRSTATIQQTSGVAAGNIFVTVSTFTF